MTGMLAEQCLARPAMLDFPLSVAGKSAGEQQLLQAETPTPRDRRSYRRRGAQPPRPRFANTIKAAKLLRLSAPRDGPLVPWHLSPPMEIDNRSWFKRCLARLLKRRPAPAQRVKPDRSRRVLPICGFIGGFALAATGSALHIGLQAAQGPAVMRPSQDGASADSEPSGPATGLADERSLDDSGAMSFPSIGVK